MLNIVTMIVGKPYLLLFLPLILISLYTYFLKVKYDAVQSEFNALVNELKLKKSELEKYKNQRPEIKTEIVTKYKQIVLKDDNCENTLQSAKNLLSKVSDE